MHNLDSHDELSSLQNGLLLAQPEEGPSHNISDGLCQFLMYYNFLKLLDTNSTESLEALLRENLRDGCRVLTAINNTSGGVNVTSPYDETVRVTVNLSQAAEGASCDPDHGNYLLHHVCTKPSITNSNLVSAIQNIVNSFAVEGEEGACDWINQSLPDPHRLAIYEGINCSTR